MAIQERRGRAYRLWSRIQEELAERDLTDAEFAEQYDISRPTLARIKTSPRGPERETVRKVAVAFDIPLREALGLAGIIDEDQADEDSGPMSPDEMRAMAREMYAPGPQLEAALMVISLAERQLRETEATIRRGYSPAKDS